MVNKTMTCLRGQEGSQLFSHSYQVLKEKFNIMGKYLTHFLAESQMRRSMPLTAMDYGAQARRRLVLHIDWK